SRAGRTERRLTPTAEPALARQTLHPRAYNPRLMVQNRWLPVVGGVLMNLALGSLYAWSVFVLPLEKEFGWKRADTSWVYTIAVVSFALTFMVAGRIQDRKGPRICAFLGGLFVSAGFVLA